MQPIYYLPLIPLHVLAVYGHHQVSLFAKAVSLRNIRNYISDNNQSNNCKLFLLYTVSNLSTALPY
jgi:hypothetical protein